MHAPILRNHNSALAKNSLSTMQLIICFLNRSQAPQTQGIKKKIE